MKEIDDADVSRKKAVMRVPAFTTDDCGNSWVRDCFGWKVVPPVPRAPDDRVCARCGESGAVKYRMFPAPDRDGLSFFMCERCHDAGFRFEVIVRNVREGGPFVVFTKKRAWWKRAGRYLVDTESYAVVFMKKKKKWGRGRGG